MHQDHYYLVVTMSGDEAWNRRIVDYSKIHGDSSEAYHALVQSLKLSAGMIVGDIMSGYGAVSKEILDHCSKQAIDDIAHRPLPIRMILTDRFGAQLRRSVQHLSSYSPFFPISRVIADTRALPFHNCLDAAVIKHGLHELPHRDHTRALKSIHAALKPRGKIFLWEMVGLTEEQTKLARDILRTKDKLAGYTSLVQNRYFAHGTELYQSLEEAGFKDANDVYVGPFHYETKNFFESDLQSDQKKLQLFNEYIRKKVPAETRSSLDYTDRGDSIGLTFSKKIICAIK